MSTTFENARVGDRVWSVRYGHATITALHIDPDYPVVVKFDKQINFKTYTIQGKETERELQTLFWQEIKFEVPEQPSRMKLINGIEIPDISFHPEARKHYYYPLLDVDLFDNTFFEEGNKTDKFRAANGLCYPCTPEGKEAALLHAKALLGVK
jgi:hypothetical protein